MRAYLAILIGSVFFFSACKTVKSVSDGSKLPTSEKKCPSKQNSIFPRVIYGNDDRLEHWEIPDPLVRKVARSSVAIIDEKYLQDQSDGTTHFVNGRILQDRENMCPSERFSQQLAIVHCSAALVGKNLVLTAGHCFSGVTHVREMRFVFDFLNRDSSNQVQPVLTRNTFKARRILLSEEPLRGSDWDIAVIELEGNVEDRPPLPIHRDGITDTSAKIYALGHPLGIPLKLSGNATIRDNSFKAYFVTNLDIYIHNSGSAAFNYANNKIEGVVVRGEPDFELKGSCRVSKVCADSDCRGQDVSRLDLAIPYIPEVPDILPDPVDSNCN